MKGKKVQKDDNDHKNNVNQSIMEQYKLMNTHNTFTSSGHNAQRKEDSNVNKQPDNSSIKTMPNYHKMPTLELKNAVAKYGVKPLSKSAMIYQLVLIWNYLHRNNYLDDESQDHEEILSNAENVLPISSTSVCLMKASNQVISSDNIVCIKEYPELSNNTKRKVKNYIISKYYDKILRYEPLQFDDLIKEIVDQGILCTEKQLQHYLDMLNIVNKSLKRSDEWKKDHKKFSNHVYI
ncbi:13802_t:CDS:2 [Funneliformis geosporum]|uniref:Structure-specific endonuclease subunit SLX4 n=1 Tax=Funneliformis geosporum TaxID=1117311 RepID=A0A9W4SFJ5_9GLOM|nr:13802_t:CDS:2 [Funneliformis geosporum]CAI2166571.1 18411_t:CDS:2 [Funneliformis geosporum]